MQYAITVPLIPAEAGLKEKLEQMLSETKLQEYKVTEAETRLPFMQKAQCGSCQHPDTLVSTQQVLPWNVLQRQALKTILLNFYNQHIGTACDGSGVGLKIADEFGELDSAMES